MAKISVFCTEILVGNGRRMLEIGYANGEDMSATVQREVDAVDSHGNGAFIARRAEGGWEQFNQGPGFGSKSERHAPAKNDLPHAFCDCIGSLQPELLDLQQQRTSAP